MFLFRYNAIQLNSFVEPNPTAGLADDFLPDTSKKIPGIKRKIPGIDKINKRLPFGTASCWFFVHRLLGK
jgi:hypothetical protein